MSYILGHICVCEVGGSAERTRAKGTGVRCLYVCVYVRVGVFAAERKKGGTECSMAVCAACFKFEHICHIHVYSNSLNPSDVTDS